MTHQEAAPARALTSPVRSPKIIPKTSRPGGGLIVGVLIAGCVGAKGTGAIIRKLVGPWRSSGAAPAVMLLAVVVVVVVVVVVMVMVMIVVVVVEAVVMKEKKGDEEMCPRFYHFGDS